MTRDRFSKDHRMMCDITAYSYQYFSMFNGAPGQCHYSLNSPNAADLDRYPKTQQALRLIHAVKSGTAGHPGETRLQAAFRIDEKLTGGHHFITFG